ncbi:MAG: hypothetical protein WB341_07385 [Terracidiphilus sp.]
MQADPIFEWQRLTEHYRRMSDDELRELAADFADLTETAQQVLRSEMRSRGLGDPQAASQAPLTVSNAPQPASTARRAATPEPSLNLPDTEPGVFGRALELVPDTPAGNEDDGPHEYTWKTVLCICETQEEARQLSEALKQAGIDSWIEGTRKYSPYADFVQASPRVLVAADQLDQARAIAARPIPPEMVAESAMKEPEFTPPACPKCGAADPVLESVNPENTWRCEQCGEQWTESPTDAEEEAQETGQNPL